MPAPRGGAYRKIRPTRAACSGVIFGARATISSMARSVAAVSSRQAGHLWRLAERLALDPELKVYGSRHPDGITYITVFAAGQRPPVGWFGGPKTDAVEDPDGDYWSGTG